MGVAAPVIESEMADWTALGGGNSGITGDRNHSYGFHLAANEVDEDDYSRWRDPQGADGPYVDWDYACAGDFSHRNDERLRALHRNVLARLMRGELPMICEFIGQPFASEPVYYWARWLGVTKLQRYTGAGHDHWSHISWYRSMADRRAHLWTPTQEEDMPRIVKVDNGPGRYLTNGLTYRALRTEADMQRQIAAGAVVDDTAVTPIEHIGVDVEKTAGAVDAAALAKALAPLLSSSGQLPAAVVDALAKLGLAADAVVAAAQGD